MNRLDNRNSETIVRNKITLITFICSLFVIWIHTYNVEVYKIDADSTGVSRIVWMIEDFWSQIIRIAVPTFFFISGFLFFRTFSLDILLEKYKKRVKGVLLPYLVWCTIYYFYFVILSKISFAQTFIDREKYVLSLKNWLLALWPEAYFTLWFLKNLICFIALAPILYFVLKNHFEFPTGLLVVLFLIINSYFGFVAIPSGLEMYAVGSYIAINHRNIVFFRNRILSYIGIVVALLLFTTKLMVLNIPLMLFFDISIWYALDLFVHKNEMPWWLSITFFTYVFHDMVLEVLEKILFILGGNNPVLAMLDYIFMPTITFSIVVLVAYVLKRIKPLWSVLCGYR